MHIAVSCYRSPSSMRLLFIQVVNTTKSTTSFKTCKDTTAGFGFLFPSDSSFIHGRRRKQSTVYFGPFPGDKFILSSLHSSLLFTGKQNSSPHKPVLPRNSYYPLLVSADAERKPPTMGSNFWDQREN